MKRTLVGMGLALAGASLAAGGTIAAPASSGSGATESPAYVEDAWVQPTSSDPGQMELYVSGLLPTPCHEPVWEVAPGDDSIDVHLWSTQSSQRMCVATLEPFDVSIGLGADDPTVAVTLNGEPVAYGAPELQTPSGTITGLAGSGWSFGMCLGYCAADLRFEPDGVALLGRDRGELDPLFENRGQLTDEGQSRIDAEIAALDAITLDAVYGCPDCADGGAAYLLFDREDGQSRHEMEFGAPPPALAALYELTTSISSALETCVSDAVVSVGADCAAYVRPTE